MIANLFIRQLKGHPCWRCGQYIVEAKLGEGWFTFLNSEPDVLGTMHIAFGRGDNGENLAHPPMGRDPQGSLTFWRATGEKPLFSMHICPKAGDPSHRPGRAAGPMSASRADHVHLRF